MNFEFAEPLWLLALLLLVPMFYRYLRRKSSSAVLYPNLKIFAHLRRSKWVFLRHLPFLCRVLSVVFIVLAMARPQAGRGEVKRKSDGLDIMLAVDTSGSMRALDFQINGKRYNRLEVVKAVMANFINRRFDDRIGMVVFGDHAFAQAPLTLDHTVLLRFLEGVEIGMAGESTAVGDAIAVATNRMKDLKAKSKIVILLTDGSNTAGRTRPVDVAKAAKAVGVKIYTIGVGSNGPVLFPTKFGYQRQVFKIDEESLQEVAKITGGKYFRAVDTNELMEIYDTIDTLEKTELAVPIFQIYDEKFAIFLWPGLFFVLFEALLGMTRLRRLP
ncbi:MAG: VWA domain-containing protein [Bdellovibrionota bacterium]